ncbi:MAG TPA: DUF2892 domain-containing protein [Gemmatimonadales bacterium]|jgi:hypothetical protein|nr:DUF2892 domain-containing protein [Gemmatimonadales bacterium]
MVIKNVGATDSGLRALLGVTLLGISASFNDRPLLAVGSGLIALVFIGTALFRVCPLYTLLGINTCPRDAEPKHG